MQNYNKKFPRVLIISAASLSTNSATGITMQNLFTGWPKENLAQIYDDISEPDNSLCATYQRFSSGDIRIVRIAKSALQRFRPRNSKTIGLAHDPETVMISGSVNYGLLNACGDITPFSVPKSISDWVAEFKPDVIYSVLGSVRIINLVLKLNAMFSTPVVSHFMDDWPSTSYSNSWTLAIPRAILNSKLRTVLARSPYRMAICEDMATEFSNRYGGRFESFMNCVEVPSQILPCFRCKNDEVRFGFVGGLHLNRWRSLLTVVTALQQLKDRGNIVVLDIFAPKKDLKNYGSLFSKFSVIGEISTLKTYDVNKKLPQFDVLVHVESFLKNDSLYTRFSVSTKIPQYMASGRPILAFGPSILSSIRYIERTRSGLTVNIENDVSALKEAAGQLVKSTSLRESLGRNGFSIATRLHNAFIERSRFMDVLIKSSKEFN